MNILLIMTGGTICSFANDTGERSADTKKAERVIIENFRRSGSVYSDADFDVRMPLNILSENMTVGDWNILIGCMKRIDYSQYDGVIILHGTDTLAYTSSLISLLMSGTRIPVMLVSSQLPLQSEGTNGNDNFRCAVELIGQGIEPNAYAVFRNSDGMYVHEASHLLQCANGSWEFFSRDMKSADGYKGVRTKACDMPLYTCPELSPSVLYIPAYVGIDYRRFSLKGVRAVLHGTYHSSTLSVICKRRCYSVMHLKKRCDRRRIPLYITPCDADSYDYETTGTAIREGVKALDRMTCEMTYVKLLLGCAYGYKGNELDEFLRCEQNGEFIY